MCHAKITESWGCGGVKTSERSLSGDSYRFSGAEYGAVATIAIEIILRHHGHSGTEIRFVQGPGLFKTQALFFRLLLLLIKLSLRRLLCFQPDSLDDRRLC